MHECTWPVQQMITGNLFSKVAGNLASAAWPRIEGNEQLLTLFIFYYVCSFFDSDCYLVL